jgi:dihydropteroate synthase
MNSRKRFRLQLRSGTLVLGERTCIMGVLNVTPDSFSDGGKYDQPDTAIQHAFALEMAGADLLDIG